MLIVGDPSSRAGVVGQVASLGYAAAAIGPELAAAALESSAPRMIVVFLDDIDPPVFMAALRRLHRGAAIPVTLCGRPADSGFDLADVLELGADHFIEEPITDDALLAALEALAGPPLRRTIEPSPIAPVEPVATAAEASGSWPTRTEVIEETGPVRVLPAATDESQMSGQLHRAFGILDARRRSPQERSAVGDSADDLDLADLGLDDVPLPEHDDGIDPGESHDRLEVAQLHVLVPGTDVHGLEIASPLRPPKGPRETTVLLEDASPVGPRTPTGNRYAPPDGVTGEVRERTSPQVSVTSEFADRPRRRVPLPLERQGDLATVEVPRLLSRLHRAAFTGKLTLAAARVEKSVWFESGVIVFARSSAGHDRLLDGLLRSGLLTRSQYAEARRMTEADGRRAGQVLVEAGLLKQAELLDALQDHLARIVDSTMPWREGVWSLEPDERCEEPIQMTTPTAVLLVEGIRQRMEPTRLLGLLGGPGAHPQLSDEAWSRPSALHDLAEGLQLSASEEAWLERLDGRSSLSQLLSDPAADEGELLAAVYALHVLELLDLPGEPIPAPRVHDDPVAIDRRRIEARLALAREADYFALLGLERDATRADVRVAWADLDRTFGEARLEPATLQELAAELAELRAALAEARDVLAHDMLRNAYLSQLEEP